MIIIISASRQVRDSAEFICEAFVSATALQYHALINVMQYLENCDTYSKRCKQ